MHRYNEASVYIIDNSQKFEEKEEEKKEERDTFSNTPNFL